MKTTEKSNADLMREWRALAGFTAKQAGLRLHVSERTIENIEQSRRREHDVFVRIALEKLTQSSGRTHAPNVL